MEIDDGLLFVVHRAIDCLGATIQHDFQLFVVVLDKLDRKRHFSDATLDFVSLGSCDADWYALTFHVNRKLHVVTPVADFLPNVLRRVLKLTLATIKNQEGNSYIIDVQIFSTVIQGFQQLLLMRRAERSVNLVVDKVLVLNHFPKVGLVSGQTL